MDILEALDFLVDLLSGMFFLMAPFTLSASRAKLLKIYSRVVCATEYSLMSYFYWISSIKPNKKPIE